MRKIRDIIRLHQDGGLSANRIAVSLNLARSVVQECLRRVRAAKLTWPLPVELDDRRLEEMLYPSRPKPGCRTLPDWPQIHQEMKKKGVTLELLWHDIRSRRSFPTLTRSSVTCTASG